MQHQRAKQRQQATLPTIKTEGNNTVSNKSTQPSMQFVFSETEYRSRCQNEKGFYESRIEKPHAGIVGAIVEFTPTTLVEALEVYHQHRAAQFQPLDPMEGLPTAMLIESPQATFISIYLRKPERDQEKDLAKLCKQIKTDYEMELAALLEGETERQVQLTLAKDERDRQKALEQDREKRAQATRDELAASREKLRDELIKSGKLNVDGSAA
ncbi:hypothetical protein [Pseudomonas ogarae]|uniref:hypothetical protein n=1 Tax=Pseudomonas ogarae (strain DSM 112162 / CECT 30235 / F113) TaxID=1114970 RepID=UPI0019506651|nr:hypothetical protein [Pseudomonas ogarae]